MLELKQAETFRKWRLGLKGERARALIASRLDALHSNMPATSHRSGMASAMLRIHRGSGYRIDFHRRGDVLIVLLCGGDRSSQARDIRLVKDLAREWNE